MAYVPGHNDKRRGIDATPPGHARWARAAHNALRHPSSQAAQLYRRRYDLALQMKDSAVVIGAKDTPFEFVGRDGKRNKTACGIFCAVMQTCLEYSVDTLPQLAEVFGGKWSRAYGRKVLRLDPKRLRRDVTCCVCAKKVRRG